MEYELKHFGVKGMRWGVRRKRGRGTAGRGNTKKNKAAVKSAKRAIAPKVRKAKGIKKIGAYNKGKKDLRAARNKLFNERSAVGQQWVKAQRSQQVLGGLLVGAAFYGLSQVTSGRTALNAAMASNIAVVGGVVKATKIY